MVAFSRRHGQFYINKPATLLVRSAHQGGCFFSQKGVFVKFEKPSLSISEQVSKLESRGLNVQNRSEAEHYLQFIGYYRLSAYTLFFQDGGDPAKPFRKGVEFRDILNLYRFDRELRLLTIDALERIEVAVRSSMVNEMCIRHGAHWFMNAGHFYPSYDHADFLKRIERELGIRPGTLAPRRPHNETFINHYYQKYGDPYLPPAWMVAETLSLGAWSLVYENLRGSGERQAVASHFGTNEAILTNWLHVLTYTRNICAHHGRLWNRKFVIKFKIARRHMDFLSTNDRYFALAVVLEDLLRRIAPGTGWHLRLLQLLQSHPFVNAAHMGFPKDWEKVAFWNSPQALTKS